MSDVLNYIQNDPTIFGITNLFFFAVLFLVARALLKKVHADEVTGGAFSDPFIKISVTIIYCFAFFNYAFFVLKPYVELMIEYVQKLN